MDDGLFLWSERGGSFEVHVKLLGESKLLFDQMGLVLRIVEKTGLCRV